MLLVVVCYLFAVRCSFLFVVDCLWKFVVVGCWLFVVVLVVVVCCVCAWLLFNGCCVCVVCSSLSLLFVVGGCALLIDV